MYYIYPDGMNYMTVTKRDIIEEITIQTIDHSEGSSIKLLGNLTDYCYFSIIDLANSLSLKR